MKADELKSAVLVLTTDNPLQYKIDRVFGVVSGAGSGSGASAVNKAAAAYVDALAMLRQVAYNSGANAVIGLRQSAFGASGGGMLGDAVGVLLSGTAVILSAAPE